MGVYQYQVPGGPFTGVGGTALGDFYFSAPPGKWTSAQAQITGSYTGAWRGGNATLGSFFRNVNGSYTGVGNDFAVIPDTPPSFDTGLFNASSAFSAVSAHQGNPLAFTFNFPSGYPSYTIQTLTVFMTGNPTGPVIAPPPMVRIAQVAPGVFFEKLVPTPSSPVEPVPPVHFPQHPLGPGFSETEFFPSGAVLLSPDLAGVPLAAGGGGRGGDYFMSCMRRKGGVYSFLSGVQTIPAIYCVNLPGDAEFLFFSPGLINSGGSSGQTSYGFRIYRGLNGFKAGQWTTGYPALSQAPDYVGAGTLANLIPWQGTLQFCVEVYGLANLPASSLLDFTVQGMDT